MVHASIEDGASHRQNKAFKQRLNYWRKKGFSPEEALRRAELKELVKDPHLRLVNEPTSSSERKPGPRTKTWTPDENLDPGRKPDIQALSKSQETYSARMQPAREPSSDEIRREVQRLKAAGVMTEIRPSEVCSIPAPARIPVNISKEREPSSARGFNWARLPYWVIALSCSTALVISTAQSLGGGLWNILIAIVFDYSPVLLVGAKLRDAKSHQTVLIGAALIILTGLTLNLAPQLQTVQNEMASYREAKSLYETADRAYREKSGNTLALVNAAKADFTAADKDYLGTQQIYGQSSWRTGVAKQKRDKAFARWSELSSAAPSAIKPIAPKYSDALRDAAQAVITRIGLFGIAILCMFVMRRMEE